MNFSELVQKIRQLAYEKGVDLSVLGLYDDDDIINYALKFMAINIEDLDAISDDDLEDEEISEDELL